MCDYDVWCSVSGVEDLKCAAEGAHHVMVRDLMSGLCV